MSDMFFPHVPSVIFDILGGFKGLKTVGASDFSNHVNCLEFNLNSNGICRAEIHGYYDNSYYFAFDVYLYDCHNCVVCYHCNISRAELADVFSTV